MPLIKCRSGILSHIAVEEHVRQGVEESRVVNKDRDDVGGCGFYSYSSLKQDLQLSAHLSSDLRILILARDPFNTVRGEDLP